MASRLLSRSLTSASASLRRAGPSALPAVSASVGSVSSAAAAQPAAPKRTYVAPSTPTRATPTAIEDVKPRVESRGNVQRRSGDFDAILQTASAGDSANRPIYLDAQSTTPVDPRVLDAMLPFLTNQYGNPHSKTHAYGWESEAAVETARAHIGALIGADAKEMILTSGATESNNMSLKGVARFYAAKKKHVITTQTEHKCVLDSARKLQEEGFEVTYLPVQSNGLISMAELEAALRPDTSVVSIMAVNNEIGVIQPLSEIGALLKSKGAALAKSAGLSGKPLFHTDAAQAVGKIELDVDAMGIDLMSLSSHKIYGPKGVGACYVRRRPRVRMEPIINGGGQERGLRSGTLAPHLVVGFGEAARLAKAEMKYDHAHISHLAQRLKTRLLSSIDHVLINGDESSHYPGCTNLSFQYVEGESLLMALKDICLSSGSACTSASLEPSYVLRALGLDDENAHSSLRFGIGRFTTQEEVDYVAEKIIRVVERLREMSPLYEMVQEGIDLKTIQWSG